MNPAPKPKPVMVELARVVSILNLWLNDREAAFTDIEALIQALRPQADVHHVLTKLGSTEEIRLPSGPNPGEPYPQQPSKGTP